MIWPMDSSSRLKGMQAQVIRVVRSDGSYLSIHTPLFFMCEDSFYLCGLSFSLCGVSLELLAWVVGSKRKTSEQVMEA